jgi:hypothetical protein
VPQPPATPDAPDAASEVLDAARVTEQVRRLLQESHRARARRAIPEALRAWSDRTRCDVSGHGLWRVQRELERYLGARAGADDAEGPPPCPLHRRRPVRLRVAFGDDPRALFFVKSDGERLLGRKLLSERWIAGATPELYCARITPWMLLGPACGERVTEDGVEVCYRPLRAEERAAAFREIDPDRAEVVFPYPYLSAERRRERRSPRSGWSVTHERAAALAAGEADLRRVTLDLLAGRDLAGAVVYDPGCATGHLLAAIKGRHPDCVTVGQDLSHAMARYAALGGIDLVARADAEHPCLAPRRANLVVCRLLNAGVVTTRKAQRIVASLARCLAPGGQMLVFGHTPPLVGSVDFALAGLTVVRCVVRPSGEPWLVPYYVLQREA